MQIDGEVMTKKIMKILGLLLAGVSLLSSGYVKSAEQMPEDVQAEDLIEIGDQVPSLQMLALKFIGKKSLKAMNSYLNNFKMY